MTNNLTSAAATATMLIGGILIYSLWTSADSAHITGLMAQDKQYEIVFDTETTGHLRTINKNLPQMNEEVSIKFENPGTYKIKTPTFGQLEFITDTKGPLFFACFSCVGLNVNLDGLWVAQRNR